MDLAELEKPQPYIVVAVDPAFPGRVFGQEVLESGTPNTRLLSLSASNSGRDGHTEDKRLAAPVRLWTRAPGKARTWVRGRGIYDITAPIAVEAAVLLSKEGLESIGTVAPAQVFDLDRLLSILAAFDLEHGMSTDRSGTGS